jgi:arylsulfatase A-like enzyme
VRAWAIRITALASASTVIDIAPTALRLFGVEPPTYMDGRPLAVGT